MLEVPCVSDLVQLYNDPRKKALFIIVPVLKVRTLGCRGAKEFVHSHKANEWQGLDLNPRLGDSRGQHLN